MNRYFLPESWRIFPSSTAKPMEMNVLLFGSTSRKISNYCMSCIAGQSLACVSCTESAVLQPDDHPRSFAFAQWFINQSGADMHFARSVLFSDEAIFSREGMLNTHSSSMWALNNPHSIRPQAEVLPELLTDVPTPVRCRMWFQQDGEPSHYGRCICSHLDQVFPKRWIGHGGPIAWPPKSSELSPLKSFSGVP
ncbi:uncharacterized protein TNCV_1600241 [Trichonephila clavipes]|nr:uncharacterized protein TNCV_1600241 [Trichonephila clavipes]